jgi:hypothetical protein
VEDRPYISYPFRSPRMDQSVPPNQVTPGSFGRLSGVDGRFNGGLRKYFGNRAVLDIDKSVAGMGDIDAYNGPDFIRQVTFQKRNTSTVYRGFVIRWDSGLGTSDEQIDLVYTYDGGTHWYVLAIWATGNGITSALEIDCAVDRGYLLVAVDTKTVKTIYWNGANLVAVTSGPGDYATILTAPTLSTTAVDTGYQLNGSGVYQVAWRFYDSTRGIYSALSDPLVIRLDHKKTTKAIGTISFSSVGGDNGLFVDGDTITINGRIYEADDDSSITGDVTVDITDLTTVSQHAQALADAINGDTSAVVTASAQSASVLLESKVRGTTGNSYTLVKSETGASTNDIAVSGATLTGGGVVTAEAETQCKAVIDFPSNTTVISGSKYTDEGDGFADLFDTVDIFRTIDLGNSAGTLGAIFYLEQTLSKTTYWSSSGTWDSMQASIGTLLDDALPFQTMYDPEKDIISSPPQSGTIGRYENQTYMAQASSVDGGYDTLFSSAEHASPEYFSTYNKRVGDPEDGRPMRFIPAGESMFQLSYNAVVHIFKSGKLRPIQISRLHRKRGIVGKEAAHSSGNSVFMVANLGLAILNGADGSMGGISAADRVIFDDWKSNLANIKSGYDSLMNASFFLNATRGEMLIIWHSTQVCTLLDGANFVGVTEGPDVTGKNDRAFFITKTGLIVSPDVLEAGSGTMWDISSSYTINGTATTAGSNLVDSAATLNDDMVGAKLYMVTGDNAGIGRTIATINNTTKVVTFESAFPSTIAIGDRYAVSPVPFSLRAWPVQAEQISRFNRWGIVGVSVKARKLSGFDNNVNNQWRVGAYRNSGTSIESRTVYPSVSENPADSVGALSIDGVDIEPYIEQIASGVSFELTDVEFALSLSDSRRNTA